MAKVTVEKENRRSRKPAADANAEWQVAATLNRDFARDYLRTFYCGDVTADEKIVLGFLASQWKTIGKVSNFVDLGCGPTVHHLFPAVGYAKDIQAYDFVPECVAEVQRWKDRSPPVHNWGPWTACTLAAEGGSASPSDIEARENNLRSSLSAVGTCDLRSAKPIKSAGQFEVVGCFYASEQASMVVETWTPERRIAAWNKVMSNIVGLVKKNGWLLMSAVGYTDHYVTYDQKNGAKIVHPLPFLTEDNFLETLKAHGFKADNCKIVREKVLGQEAEGVTDVLLVAARR